jgi:hypothetical protein
MFMTGFITLCWKKWAHKGLMLALLWTTAFAPAWAQSGSVEFTQFKLEKSADQLLLSSSVQFELPPAVEDALLKGVPVFFVAEVDIYRERWYWLDKKVAGPTRHMRLAFQPLTRRWRLGLSNGPMAASGQSSALNQNFETLSEALAAIRRISGWPVAELSELEAGAKYRLDYRFYLDLTQLPRPLQIGALGQSDWNLSTNLSQRLSLEALK